MKKYIILIALFVCFINSQCNSPFGEKSELVDSLLGRIETNVILLVEFTNAENHIEVLKYAQETDSLLTETIDIITKNRKVLYGERNINQIMKNLAMTKVEMFKIIKRAKEGLNKKEKTQ